jgi:glycosyltransferase involved in cell wall biosynthesis
VRIAIDARKLHDYGIGTYVRNLVRALARQDTDDTYVLLCPHKDREFVESLGPRFEALEEPAGNYSVREQISVPVYLWRARVDLFHAPHYVVSPLTLCPFVVTIHDCIHLRFPQYLPNRAAYYYARVVMSSSARRARRVLTVSRASKQDILHFLKIPADKIEVIYNALDEGLAAAPSAGEVARVQQRFQLTSPFVLYAGNIKPHKNVDRLIHAFSLLRQRGAGDTKLLVIGDEVSKYQNLRRRVRARRDAGRALPAGLGVRLSVALRGLRAAAARGDGRRRAGDHVECVVAARGRRRCRAAHQPTRRRRDRRGDGARARGSRAARGFDPPGPRAREGVLVAAGGRPHLRGLHRDRAVACPCVTRPQRRDCSPDAVSCSSTTG